MPVITFEDGTSMSIPDRKPETIAAAKAEYKRQIGGDVNVLGDVGRQAVRGVQDTWFNLESQALELLACWEEWGKWEK